MSASAKVERWKLSQQAINVWYTPIAGNLPFGADWMSRAVQEVTVGFCLGASADVKGLKSSFHNICLGASADVKVLIGSFHGKDAISSFHGQSKGHWGIDNTLDYGGFDWEGMRRDVADFVSSCPHCTKD